MERERCRASGRQTYCGGRINRNAINKKLCTIAPFGLIYTQILHGDGIISPAVYCTCGRKYGRRQVKVVPQRLSMQAGYIVEVYMIALKGHIPAPCRQGNRIGNTLVIRPRASGTSLAEAVGFVGSRGTERIEERPFMTVGRYVNL